MHLIIKDEYILDTKEFLDYMDKDTYVRYLNHIVDVIKKRKKILLRVEE